MLRLALGPLMARKNSKRLEANRQQDEIMGHRNMMHNTRILKNQNQISEFEKKVPKWIRRLQRPSTPPMAPIH